MDETQGAQDREFLELIVLDMATRATQLPPDERQAFIMSQIDQIRTIFDEKYGEHPNPLELDGKLRNWVRAFVWKLANPRSSYKPLATSPDLSGKPRVRADGEKLSGQQAAQPDPFIDMA